ncbi:MAG: hypothetical protein C4520_01875 [Candidatus Abyssobacteria bacterium SURF_5]|uniref:Uncharacterized protein n=1 Tax=Abyssobacteria bacterium (strain SURF_5) TaxID=2093360 RepID=A0A3A4P5A2_ABYX5|nr:MAG: hypothetical protein C4520_01875 [Candidatus Abyssubacteria bacterium SURF_5]
MASEIMVFSQNDERIIFWITWIFLITQYPQKAMDKYLLKLNISRDYVMYGYIIFMLLFGVVLWRLFRIRRFFVMKNVLIGLQGFFLFHLFLFAAWLGTLLLFHTLFPRSLPHWISSALGIALFYLATFLGGCWIGHKNKRLTFLWCVIGVITLYYKITLGLASFQARDMSFVIASLIVCMAGAVVGKRYLKIQPVQ